MHEASREPLEGAVSGQTALQGSEMETRELLGGSEENSISLTRGHWFALSSQANQWGFLTLPEVMLMDATVNIIVIVFIVSHGIIDLVNFVRILVVQPMQLKYIHNMKRCS